VLDFQNNSAAITFAFQGYYRTTLLAEESAPRQRTILSYEALESPQHADGVTLSTVSRFGRRFRSSSSPSRS
jgi:hypothetical protein